MNTTTAATQAGVTTATIRAWCRRNVIAATKAAGRWTIDAASLARRIALGAARRKPTAPPLPDLTDDFVYEVQQAAYDAADAHCLPALRKLLADVKARNIAAVMGNIGPDQVRLSDTRWAGLVKLVSLQAGCAIAEH